MRRLGFLSAALALAACSQQGAGGNETTQAVTNAPAPEASPTWKSPNLAGGSWNGVFAEPAKVLEILGRIGLRPGPYEKVGGQWRSVATPTPLTDPSGPHPVVATFVASGDANRLDRIEYALHEPTLSSDQQARDQFDRWVKQSLEQLGVTGGETVVKAIHGTNARFGSLKGGADFKVERTTTPEERRLTVTFTRSAPTPGQTNQGSI